MTNYLESAKRQFEYDKMLGENSDKFSKPKQKEHFTDQYKAKRK